jgi:adenosine deaminase
VIAKAELHCHLEGSIAPTLAIKLAERNGLTLPDGLMRGDGTYEWRDFLGFLGAYDGVCTALRTPHDFSDVIYSYLAGVAAQGAVYVEMFCSPERPLMLNMPYTAWLGALVDGIDRAEREFGIVAASRPSASVISGPTARSGSQGRSWPIRIPTSWASAWAATRPSSRRPISRRPTD